MTNSISFSGNSIKFNVGGKTKVVVANNPKVLAHCKKLALDSIQDVWNYIKGV